MIRSFIVAIPADANYHNLYSLLVGTAVYGLVNGGTNETGITGSIPGSFTPDSGVGTAYSGILPDRWCQVVFGGTTTTGVLITDRNSANSSGFPMASGVSISFGPLNVNAIDLKEIFVKGNALTFNLILVSI